MGFALGVKALFGKKPTHAELATKKELQEELKSYVTQSRFDEFKAEMRGDMKEIKTMITNAVTKVEEFAEKSYQARKGIHKQVNEIDKKQAALDAIQSKALNDR